ncbi:MAG: hypothetical protein RLY11_758, partial [Bacteroidota bacterium]
MKNILFSLLLVGSMQLNAQVPVNPDLLKGSWRASWITCPNVAQRDYGVYHFRKSFTIDDIKEKF